MPFQPSGRPYSAGAQWGGILGNTTAGLGEGVGKGIQQGLDFLAHEKMLHMQGKHAARQRERERQETAQGYEPLFGKEGASALSRLSTDERKILFQNPAIVQQLFGGGQDQYQQAEQMQPNRQQGIQALASQAGITPEQIAQVLNPMGRQPSAEAQQMAATREMQQPQQQQQMQNPAEKARLISEAFTPEATKIQREKLGLQRYQTFQPKFTEIEKEGRPARSVKKTAEDALNILKTRLAKTGVAGTITPKYLQTPEGQELDALLNKIVLQNAQLGKGIPSVARLKIEAGSKAGTWQHAKTIENILNKIVSDPEINRDIARDEAREELLQKYGSAIPDDILPRIEARSREIMKESSSKETKNALSDLQRDMPASNQEEGDIAVNETTGQDEFIVRNGRWEKI